MKHEIVSLHPVPGTILGTGGEIKVKTMLYIMQGQVTLVNMQGL